MHMSDVSNHYSSRPSSPSTSKKAAPTIRPASPPDADGPPPGHKRCTYAPCRTYIPSEHPYKGCDPCRLRNREEHRKYRARKMARETESVFAAAMEEGPASEDGQGVEEKKRKGEDDAQLSVRKKPKVDGEATPPKPAPAKPAADTTLEYQSASLLHATLRAQMRRRAVPDRRFLGTYAVVSEPGVALDVRVVRVQVELKRAAKLRLGKVKKVENLGAGWRARYPCECAVAKKAKALDTVVDLGEGAGPAMPKRVPGPPCNGELIITCCADRSHPFLVGERVTVQMLH